MYNVLCVCGWVFVHVGTVTTQARRGLQILLKLELYASWHECWRLLNVNPLQEQYTLLTTKLSLPSPPSLFLNPIL